MTADSLTPWIGIVSALSALIVGLVTALWAYARFVLDSALLPRVQFDVDCDVVGEQHGKKLLEIVLHLRNVGGSTLIARDLRVDVLYLEDEDTPELSTKPGLLGKAHFTRSLSNERDGDAEPRGFSVIPAATFVQSGVDQRYTFVTVLPSAATYALVWSGFHYAQAPGAFQRVVFWFSRRLGLIQFTLQHVTEQHTAERVFKLE